MLKNIGRSTSLSNVRPSLSRQNTSHSMFRVHRNIKSIKMLGIHLNQYKTQTKQNEQQQKHNISDLKNNNQQNIYLDENSQKNNRKQKGKHEKKRSYNEINDQNYQGKISTLIDNLLLNIQIFKKVFASSRRKRTVISKLYGWDSVFDEVFFTKHGSLYSEQFRTDVTKQSIISDLNLERRTFQSQNIYNKMRLFLVQLINENMTHQQLQSSTQRQKLSQSCSKLRSNLQKLSNESTTRKCTLKQIQVIKQTHMDILKMKMKIKNKSNQISRISRLTGEINVNPFYLKQQQNIDGIQTFINCVTTK